MRVILIYSKLHKVASNHTHLSRGREAQYQGCDLTGAKEESCRAHSLVGRLHSTLHYTRPVSVRIVETVVDCNVSWSEANTQEVAAYDDLVEERGLDCRRKTRL